MTDINPISNHGAGYKAVCTYKTGSAPSKKVIITEFANASCTTPVTLNKTVSFTDANIPIYFKHNTMPSVENVYMKAVVELASGGYATMEGRISAR